MKGCLIFTVLIIIKTVFGQNNPTACPNTNLQWFPHTTDCSRYFVCRQGDLFERSCAPGLLFNNVYGQCTIPQNSYCALSCPQPDDSEILVFLPNFDDCSKFYICDGGHAVPWGCAEGLLFDTNNNWCDFPENVDCASRGNGSINGDSNRTSTTTTERTTTTRSTDTPYPTLKPDVFNCPIEYGIHFYPHTIYCHKYFKCEHGIATLLECESGLIFDYIESVCKEDGQCYADNATPSHKK